MNDRMKDTRSQGRARQGRRFGFGLPVAVALAMMAATGNAAAASPKTATGLVGYLSFDTGINPFAVALANATVAAAKNRGVELDYVNGNGNLAAEIGAIQTFMGRGAKVIIVFPPNETALVPILNEAASKGIPIIDENEALAKNANIFTYVGDNDYTYGEDEARLLVQALHGQGRFALARGIMATASQINRTAGIEHILAGYPKIHMVASETDNYASGQGLALAQDWTSKYPDLGAIVYEGPEGVDGAKWAHAHGHQNVQFILGDYPTFVRPAIEEGDVFGTVDQSPILEAQDSMIAAYDILTGQGAKVPRPAWYVPLPLVTKANVAKIVPAW